MINLAACRGCGIPIDMGSRTKKKIWCDNCLKIRRKNAVKLFMERKNGR